MYTRCASCHTVHPVNAALLARAGGRYRCGKCKSTGNALEALFDEWPDAGTAPPAAGSLPELGARLERAATASPDLPPGDDALPGAADTTLTGRARPGWLRAAWILAAVALLLAAGASLARYFGMALPDRQTLIQALERAGLRDAPPAAPFRALDRIGIVSREMIAHPDRPGVLRLDITLVNRAGQAQRYPDIEVTLLDLDNRAISRQRFTPATYLTRTADLERGMIPNALVGLTLEVPDPGDRALGFELEFH